MSPDLTSPWREFLKELDGLLDERFSLHCMGGFAIVAGFGLPRSTNDLDYRAMEPYDRVNYLQEVAGPGSALSRKHGVHLQYSGVGCMPENYESRLIEVFPRQLNHLRILIPDAYDLVLSKLGRNASRDREDVEFLAKTQQLDAAILRERYVNELRPIMVGPERRHDTTLNFWIEAYFEAGPR